MPIALQNDTLHITLDPIHTQWEIEPHNSFYPHITSCLPNVRYRTSGISLQWGCKEATLGHWPAGIQIETLPLQAKFIATHGPMQGIAIWNNASTEALSLRVEYLLSQNQPMLLWRMIVQNQSKAPVIINQLELLNAGFIQLPHTISSYRLRATLGGAKRSCAIRFPELSDRTQRSCSWREEDIAFLSHGWQTFSHSQVYRFSDRARRSNLGLLAIPVAHNSSTPRSRRMGNFSSDFFAVMGDRRGRSAFLAGFLSQKQQYGSAEAYLGAQGPALRLFASGDEARLDPNQQMVTDWACLYFFHLDAPDPLAFYFNAVRLEHAGLTEADDPARSSTSPWPIKAGPAGWCSWYQFYNRLCAEDVRENIAGAQRLQSALPLSLIQIDDGYEAQIGDWLVCNDRFPAGMAALAAEIRQAGFIPGIWQAPFIVHRDAAIYKKHPDWLLRDRFGKPVIAGYLWDSFPTALDLTHPDALAYACRVTQEAARQWGYSFLKLDFLYAAALPGRHLDPTQTRAQVLRHGLEALREAVGPETYLLGCGCPIGSAVGLMDAMRINPDVDPSWRPSYRGFDFPLRSEPNLPSARNAIRNALARAALHRHWWLNDADCLLLRPETKLSLAEVQMLATVVGLTSGMLLVSDHLPDLPPERLRIAECLLPMINQRPYVLDWFDQPTPSRLQLDLKNETGAWHLLVALNWMDQDQNTTIHLRDTYLDPDKSYLAREFWSGRIYASQEGCFELGNVAAHGAVVLAVRSWSGVKARAKPQYLGSDLHLSQGLEVTNWEPAAQHLTLRLSRPGRAQGNIYISSPRLPKTARVNGNEIIWKLGGYDVIEIPVNFERTADCFLEW